MSPKSYELCGFACGRSSSPQFVEPVFFNKERMWVQSCPAGAEKIVSFVEYNEDTEFIESSPLEVVEVGSSRIFAVRDMGDRIVCGNKAYVEKYLSQNLRGYLDKPYFLFDAVRFSKKYLPEIGFINSDKDLLHSAVLSGSLKRYCYHKLSSTTFDADGEGGISLQGVDQSKRIVHWMLDGPREASVFDEWANFAEADSPKLLNSTDWRYLSIVHKAVTSNIGDRDVPKTYVFLRVAQEILERDLLDSDKVFERQSRKGTDVIYRSTSSSNSRTFKLEPRDELRFDSEWARIEVGPRRGEPLNGVAKKIFDSILERISDNLLSTREISMSVYFLKLVVKFAIEFDQTRRGDEP